MKKMLHWSCLLMAVISMFSCGKEKDTVYLRSEEEIRLDESCHIDTTALRAVLNPDTIEGWEQLSQLTAEAWMLIDDSTGVVISQKNAYQRMFPASLTKMMTCLLTLENGEKGDTIEITEDVYIEHDCRVRLGDQYLLGDLLHEMMMQSDNDAANALAKHLGGDIPSFCDMMNKKAEFLRMDSTHFANPNGMPNDSTYSTAHDLLVLARYCMRDTAFAKIVGSPLIDVPLIDGRHIACQNTNLLLGKYDGCIGVKTGYTRQAGSCLASAATRNGITLHLVLLKSRSRSSRFSESATLLDYGFRVAEAMRKAQ
jgi:D-alanyl-D-alanine carboxypeptidase